METKEKKISSKEIYKGKILDLFVDDVELPNGNKSKREVIRHCKASAVLAFDIKGDVILEDQYRYPYDDTIIEIPAGKADGNEDPLVTAKRELEEETGYKAENVEFLGSIYPSCAYTDEIIYIYLATGLTIGTQHLDADESLNYYKVSYDKLLQMINDGKIHDAKLLAAVAFYQAKYKKNK
ncbi:MAG: NUDIX hydrolase [Bacilli bacterium]